jgi:nucleoside-diphosphate-sugar epimerase
MSQADDLAGSTVLVTGASGFLGSRTVAILSEQGFSVHALVRKTSRTDHLRLPKVTIFHGDVGEAETLKSAFEGADYVIHTAADTGGSEEGGKLSTIQGTRNILALCEQYKVKKLVYISSCNVYGVADYGYGQVVTEESSLERFPEKRGHYTHAKLMAEQLVTKFMEKGTVPIVCLRPGTIYGPGGDIYTPMIGFSLGNKFFAVIGDGRFVLPLVYVDNLVEAIVVAMKKSKSTNKFYNVVDPVKVTKRDYMEGLIKKLYPDSRTLYIPFTILKMIVYFQEKLFAAMKRRPVLTRYRLISSQKPILYDVSRIVNDLEWKPPVTVTAAFENVITYEKNRN